MRLNTMMKVSFASFFLFNFMCFSYAFHLNGY